MDLNVLKTFVAVCEYSGFSAAAEKLGYSQSTVSSQIKQLETELNVVLFDRIRHNIKMTNKGSIVLSYAKEILALNQRLNDALHRPEKISGTIRLAMSNSVCSRFFGQDYLEFHRKYPDVMLNITAGGTEKMFDMLRKNEADIVFTLDSHIYDSEFIICGESMETTHFVVSPDHPLANEDSLKLRDLIGEPFFLTEQKMSYRKMLETRLAEESLEIIPILEVGDPSQISDLVKKSKAISFLPDFITRKNIEDGSLVYLPVDDVSIQVWTQILMHKNKWCSLAMETFIDYYKEIIRQ